MQHEPCSIGRAMEVLGERWTFLIVREAFFGVRRFTELQRNLGIARNILSARLQTLTRAGILEKIRYQQEPERYEYKLTAMGRDLYPAIVSIMRWGDEYLAGDGGPPLLLYHQECGHHASPTMVCSHCGETLDPRKVTPEPGPGARVDTVSALRPRKKPPLSFGAARPASPSTTSPSPASACPCTSCAGSGASRAPPPVRTPSSACSTTTSPGGSPRPATRSPRASTTTSSRSTSSRPARAPRRT